MLSDALAGNGESDTRHCVEGWAAAGRLKEDTELEAGRFRVFACEGHHRQKEGQTRRGKAMHRPSRNPALTARTTPTVAKVSNLHRGPCTVAETPASNRVRK